MKVFLGYIFLCAIIAVILRKKDLTFTLWMLAALCVLVCIGYFVFNQI